MDPLSRPMSAALEIVSASPSDVEQLFVLAKATFGDMGGWNDERVLGVMRRDDVFVARENEQPAGHVALQRDASAAAVVVEQLFVAPGHERRGVGRRLLAHAEGYAIAGGAAALRIVVEESNWRARRFYHDTGFVAVDAELLELVLPHRL